MAEHCPQVLVVGGGFVGFDAMRWLARQLPADAADLVLVNQTGYLLRRPAAAGHATRPAT